MKKIIVVVLNMLALGIFAQGKFYTKEAKVYFDATSSLEKIDATNNKGVCVIDFTSGDMEFSVLVAGFLFEKALMQEHFQENYMEITKFPKANFKGKITDTKKINLKKDGIYPIDITGQLTLHGVTKDTSVKGKIEVKGGKIMASSKFSVLCEDYKIPIPSVVKDKIAKTVNIDITGELSPLVNKK